MLVGIGHVAVATADLDRLVAFYEEVFGAEVSERHGGEGGPVHAFVRVGPVTVLHAFERADAVAAPAAGRPRPFTHGPIDHFTLEASDPGSFLTFRRRLLERGCASEQVTDFGSLVSVFFTDPDGLLLELSLWKPPGWVPPVAVTPFGGPAGGGGR